MTRSLMLLAALVCAGCITQSQAPPATGLPIDGADADAGPLDDGGLDVDASQVDGDQFLAPDIDMGEEIPWEMPDAMPPPEPEPEPEPGPRWRPDAIEDGEQVVLPLDIVCLDAADIVPPAVIEGRGWAYEWRIVELPLGARVGMAERYGDARRPLDTAIPDDITTPQACLFLPSAGDYLTELVMHDTSMDETFTVARMQVNAAPDQTIHVELTWDTPGDPDQTDSDGADVDLHVRHPTGRNWAQAPLDCYYANAAPDWGPPGPPGNPSLDIDDVNGSGPEHINLDEPEDTHVAGGLYHVGVDYYRADNFGTEGTWGASTATVRIFLNGELAHEAQREMLDTHHFWTVAGIEWIDGVGRIVPIDQYFAEVP